MDDKEDLKLGDIVPYSARAWGKSYIRCMDIRYGVIVAFTAKGNPRVGPLYFKQPQSFTAKGAYDWYRKFTTIIPRSIKLMPNQVEVYLAAGKRRDNYNNIMREAIIDMKKRSSSEIVHTSTTSYFTFN